MSNKDAGEALQKAMYDALQSVTEGGAAVPVYDHVPQGTSKPYIVFGGSNVNDWSTKDDDGTEHEVEIEYFSAHRGKKAALEIGQQIYDALHNQTLTVEENQVVLLQFTDSQCDRESDGLTYRGSSKFRALLNYTG